MSLTITPVLKTDLPTLLQLSKSTFIAAFAAENSTEDMDLYLAKKMNLPQLTAEFETSGSRFFFAWFDNNIVGYLKLNTGLAQNETLLEKALEIERIYIIAGHQGKKFGQQLLDYAIGLAKADKLTYVWLGVWEHNIHAMRFYTRNGFRQFAQHDFMLGNDQQTDVLMKLEI